MSRNTLRKHKFNNADNSGFTLVEMIVAITIVGILATITTLGVLAWQDWSRFNRENEYAQTIYVAAQNQLTAYSSSGYLEEFTNSLIDPEALKDESVTDYSEHYLVDTLPISGVVNSKGDSIQEDDVWKELGKSGKGKYGNKIVVLKVDKGEYTDAITLDDARGNGELLEKYWVYALLDSYIADKAVLKQGTISIELSPSDGQVYSVLYSDSLHTLKYSGASANEYNAKDRTQGYREQFMVGYFGVDTLTKSVEGRGITSALTLKNVILNNRELLYLSFSQDKNTVEVNNTSYDIYIYNSEKNDDKPQLRIKLSFPDIIAKKGGSYLEGATTPQNAKEVMLPVYRYFEAAGYSVPSGATEDNEEIGELPFLVWKTDSSTVNIALDAVDYQASTWLYENNYAKIHANGYAAEDTEFDNTYSYFRFGLNNDNIKCGIVASAPTYSNSPVKYSNSENPVYYSEKQKIFGLIDTGYIKRTHIQGQYDYTYSIKNARHLYNVRYSEDVDMALTPDYTVNSESVTFELINDIDWRNFTGLGNVYASNLVDNANDIASMRREVEGESADYYFPSICALRNNDTLKSRDGRNYTISRMSISENANRGGRISLSRKKTPGTETYEYQEKPATALILINEGSVKNITLDEMKVEGGDYTAGFIGINAAAADREITNLVLKNTDNETRIEGDANVGGIIGFVAPSDPNNTAVISNLVNWGNVSGHTAVGGIVGMVRNDYEHIEKPEAVRTQVWDYIKSQQGNLYIRIEECENYGLVEGATVVEGATSEEIAQKAQADRYIGGIAGYCYNTTELSDESDENRIVVARCVSTPLYQEDDLPSGRDEFDKKLKGVYVGGVLGYNRYGAIEDCSTRSNKGKGYVFGYRYVGGIVGLNIGPAKGTEIVGSNAGHALNTNNVFGCKYVGGITGCNAGIYNKLSDGSSLEATQMDPVRLEDMPAVDGIVPIMIPDEDKHINVLVKNWSNSGVVIATDSYGGGITGFNAGWIYKCKSQVDADEAAACLAAMPGSSYLGEYIGGIAGYNNGNIGFTQRDENGKKVNSNDTPLEGVTVYVTGKNFVGGIVGYNAEDAIVEDYRVDGGYIHGSYEGSFIGGYAGFNESVDFLMEIDDFKPRHIYSSPNEISGRFFVGGNVGGNIINTKDKELKDENGSKKIINAVFTTDNFLGKLEGKAFVGGFVGYNMFFSAADDLDWVLADEDANKGATFVLTKLLKDRVNEIASGDEVSDTMYQQELNLIDNLTDDKEGLGIDYDSSDCVFVISGFDDSDNWSTKTDLGMIQGDIYVGGVLGYNDADSYLYMSSIQNSSNVLAERAIEREIEQTYTDDEETGKQKVRKTDYLGRDFHYTYSYAGGIIGKNSEHAIIDNCWNASNVSVDTKGTYTGGLCEINEGTIIHCNVSSFGSSVTDYVGGLCGLNKGKGLNKDLKDAVTLKDHCNLHKDEDFEDGVERGINHCSFENRIVSGRNVVGGIAAENFGCIKNITIDGAKLLVDGDAKTKEGVCGIYAGVNGEFGTIVLENDITGISIKSGGSNVGSVAGVNAGKLDNQRYAVAEDKKDDEPEADADDTVQNSFYNLVIDEDCKIEGYKNVGGLIGLNLDENKRDIEHYTNKCGIIATHGNAGGIIGSNEAGSTILHCLNNAAVAATDDGNAGGITAVNKGTIRECYDYEAVSAPKGMSGGMVAINYRDGIIEDCIVEPDPETSGSEIEFISTKAVGGIAAQNSGEINDNELNSVKVTNYNTTRNTRIGVIAGENLLHGIITLSDALVVEDCSAIAETDNCKVGGIAGYNDGQITGLLDNTTLLPRTIINPEIGLGEAKYASLGGVAGCNTGDIRNIAVNARIYGNMGSGISGYGGIAGYSGYTDEATLKTGRKDHNDLAYPAVISNCTFDGIINAQGSSGAPARIGGVAGINAYGSKVEECYLGVLSDASDAESKKTFVTAGDYLHKTDESVEKTDVLSYSNTGGLAGENYGFIGACDNYAKSTDEVNIIGFAGETGGIVGYNYPHAKLGGYVDEKKTVHYLSTGKAWAVDQRCEENDRGPGGIIGKCDSAEDLCYIRNYAFVKSMFPTNNKVGGIIGILWQNYKSQTLFYRVENYGEVKSSNMSGGFCGQIRGTGAILKECKNFGNVTFGSRYGGGFIGYHNSYTNPIDFYSCENHGNIISATTTKSDSSVGGFLGEGYPVREEVVNYIYDCVNTGNIIKEGDYPSRARTGSFVGKITNQVILELCRNYNTTDIDLDGFVATGSTKDAYKTKVKDCLDVTNTRTTTAASTPFGGNLITAEGAYYLNDDINEVAGKDYGVYFTWHEGVSASDMKWMDTNYTTVKDAARYLAVPENVSSIKTNSKTPGLIFNMTYAKDSKGIDSFVVYGWNENATTDRAYDYTAVFTDDSGATATASGSFVGKKDLNESKAVIKVPSGLGNKIKSINISFAGTANVSLRGFAFVPKADTSVVAACRYASEKNDMAFCLGAATKTNTGAAVDISRQLPNGHTYKLRSDVFDIDWTDYSYFKYSHDANAGIAIPINVTNGKKSTGMESFVFYVGNNNTKNTTAASSIRTYHYKYSVTMTDVKGVTATTGDKEIIGYDGSVDWKSQGRCEVKLSDFPKQLDSQIESIVLEIRAVYYTVGTSTTKKTDDNNVYMKGFAYVPKGSQEQKMVYGGDPESNSIESYLKTKKIIKLVTDKSVDKTAPYVHVYYDYNSGFKMSANDPSSSKYFSDHTSYAASKAAGTNSRINVYEDIDDKFVKFVQSELSPEDTVLKDPENLSLKKELGSYKLNWDSVEGAAGYELYYVLKDSKGEVKVSSEIIEIGSALTKYNIPLEEDWVKNKYVITCYVRAIHSYHKVNRTKADYQKYDSNFVPVTEALIKEQLPTPKAHIEVIAGNRAVIVLENYDEYVANGCSDCTLNFLLDVYDYSYDVGQYGRQSLPVNYNITSKDYKVLYWTEPNESIENFFTPSLEFVNFGQAATNNNLMGMNQYCASTAFNGFFGNDINAMTYGIKMNLDAGKGDSYQTTDISAYDEAIGATVVYDYERTHTANSTGKGAMSFTSTLKHIPQNWFASKTVPKITARAYLYKSQADITFYGHDVCDVVTPLNAEAKTAEEVKANQEILASIYDDRYVSADSDRPEANCVWDPAKKDFKPGYMLQRSEEGDYKIIYSSVIEMAMANAASAGNAYREYLGFSVASVIYSSMEAETGKNTSNNKDFANSYFTRGVNDKHAFGKDNFSGPGYGNQNIAKVQEIMSEPIVEEFTIDESSSHIRYHLSWDKYYRDNTCYSTAKNYYDSTAKLTNPDTGEYATYDEYVSRLSKSGLSSVNDEARLRLMNAYYYDYSNAEYQVELLGKTIEGEEVVIATKKVSTKTALPSVTGKKTRSKADTTYDVWQYECDFVDENDNWGGYPEINVRIIRLGSNTTGRTMTVDKTKGPLVSELTDTTSASIMRLPRYTEASKTRKLKLNTMSKPSVTITKDEITGDFETTTLSYDVLFGAITDENQLEDLGGYIIHIKVKEAAEGSEPTADHFYYVKDIRSQSTPEDDINIDMAALKKMASTDKVVVEELKIGENAFLDYEPDTHKAVLDLSDFKTGECVSFTIQAVTRKHAKIYKDGDEGVETELVIPSRLDVPKVELLSLVTGEDAGIPDYEDAVLSRGGVFEDIPNTVSYSEYERGFSFVYDKDDEAYASEPTARIQMAVAVFDEITESGEAWDEGAVATLFAKTEPMDLGNVASEQVGSIKLTDYEDYKGQWAGKYIKIALKAASSSRIDSKWTDDEDERTSYKWIHIPKLLIEGVEIHDSTGTLENSKINPLVKYYYDGGLHDKRKSAGDDTFEQVTVGFDADINASGYRITLKETGKKDSEEHVKTPVFEIFTEKNEEQGFETYIASVKDADTEPDEGKTPEGREVPVCKQNAGAVWIGTLSENCTAIDIKSISAKFTLSELEFFGRIMYEPNETGGSFTLAVPDLQKTDLGVNLKDYLSTDAILVETYCENAEHQSYVTDSASLWQKEVAEGSYTGKNLTSFMSLEDANTWRKSMVSMIMSLSFEDIEIENEEITDGEAVEDDSVSENEIQRPEYVEDPEEDDEDLNEEEDEEGEDELIEEEAEEETEEEAEEEDEE